MHGNSSHDVRSRIAVMSSLSCSFCQHANPPDAKFCNECGSPLNLEPCARCEAVNDVHATRCHGCGAELDRNPLAAANGTAPGHAVVDADPSCTSIVKALETVEADLATIARSEAVAGVVTVGPSEEPVPELQQPTSRRTHRLRPALFAAFVAFTLAAVLLGPRLPLPPALSHATLATTSLVLAPESAPVPAPDSAPVPAPDSAPVPAAQPGVAPKQVRDAAARTSSGPIEAIMPAAASPARMLPASASASTTPASPSASTSPAFPSTGIAEAVQPVAAPAAHAVPAQDDPASDQVDALPYPVPSAQCTEGVAAMGLCNREGAKDGR
jgi:ribosomal protein L40E